MIHIDETSYHCGIECVGTLTDVHIGKYTSIGKNCTIDCGGIHKTDNVSVYPMHRLFPEAPSNVVSNGSVWIGNDVWIAQDVILLSGIEVGDGAIIGVGSVVTKCVAPYEIVGGSPAKHIRMRFHPDQIAKLFKIMWWDWELSKIQENVSLLMSGDIEKFLSLHT